jgi:biopolymer transport protein ExbB
MKVGSTRRLTFPEERVVIELLISGGPVMIPIGAASLVGLAVFLERVFSLRMSRVIPNLLVIEVDELLKQGRWADVVAVTRKYESAAGRVVLAAVDARTLSRSDIKERLEEVGRREAAELERYSAVLGTVASVAPLLGLLGTVWGMILTFEVIQSQGMGVVANLAGGISQALISTMAGLSVGIPALVAYRWVLARADRLILELEELGSMMIEHITSGESAE